MKKATKFHPVLGIIGGTGIYQFDALTILEEINSRNPLWIPQFSDHNW